MGKYISYKEKQRKKYDGMPTLYAYCDACQHRNDKEKCNAVREKDNDYCNKIIRRFEREQQKISDETAPEYYVTVRQRGVEKFVSFDLIGKYMSLKTVYQDCSKFFKEDAEVIADILQQEIDAGNACYTDVEIREVLMDVTGDKRAKRYNLDKKTIQAQIKYPKYMNKTVVRTKKIEVPDDYALMITDTKALVSKEQNRVRTLDQSQLELLGGGFCPTVPADSPVDILKLLIKPYNSFERMPLDYVYKNTVAYLDSLTTPIIDSNNNIIYINNKKEKEILDKSNTLVLNQMLTSTFDSSLSSYLNATMANYKPSQIYSAKSGTTSSDSYVMAYNPNYTIGIWVGTDSNEKLSNYTLSKQLFMEITNLLQTKKQRAQENEADKNDAKTAFKTPDFVRIFYDFLCKIRAKMVFYIAKM